MKKLVSIILWVFALLVGVCLTACSRKDLVEPSYYYSNNSYLELNISFPNSSITRANPTGGEDGDGREDEKYYEDAVDNLMVFIFRSSAGFDADASTTFLYKGYFENGDAGWTMDGTDITVKFKLSGYIPLDGDRVIVVANVGDISSAVTNLGQLRDYTNYSSWTDGADITQNKRFVMSSAYNDGTQGIVDVSSHDGSYSDPYFSDLYIQRTAARIDFMYNSTDNLVGAEPYNEWVYNVREDPDDASSAIISKVHVQNIIPLNLMQEPSYLIKRVTSSNTITSAVKYGAKETTTDGVPDQYVIEPHTLLKETTVADATLNTWYGSTRAKTIMASPSSYLAAANGIENYMKTSTAKSEMGYFTHYVTLAYTNENTQSKDHNDPAFLTGLLLKAIYQPLKVYKSYAAGVLTLDDDLSAYATGKTFWRYSPTKALMGEKDCLYFSNKAAAEAYKADHATDLAEISEYVDGICYYTIWLRHANIDLDPHTAFPMEYGIVRNNIYRIGVEQCTGPGPALPVYEDPKSLSLRIFVRKWNLREQPVIRL